MKNHFPKNFVVQLDAVRLNHGNLDDDVFVFKTEIDVNKFPS